MIHERVGDLQRLVGTDSINKIIFDRLLPLEKIVMIDGPAEIAFFFQQKWSILVLIGSVIVAFYSSSVALTAAALVAAVLALVVFAFGAVQLHYTRYVVTTNRIIYITGVLNRTHQWIPWAKVTDLSMEQSIWERVQNVGRVRIESANEDSQFREMKNLTNPETMMRVLVFMVSQRQGAVPVPEDIYAILGVDGPDGVTYLPRDYVEELDDHDDGDGDDHGPNGDGGDDDGPIPDPDTGPDGPDGADPTSPLPMPSSRTAPTATGGPLAPGTVTVPRPAQGEESRPSRANPVQDVGGEDPPFSTGDDPALWD